MNNYHTEHGDLVGAYALDALDPTERDSFESHLLTCSSCRSELAELQQVVGVLPLAVEMVEPQVGLRSRIIAAIEDEENPRASLTLLPGGEPTPRKRSRLASGFAGFAVAAAVLIAALGVWNVRLQDKVNQQNQALSFNQEVASALAKGATVMKVRGTAMAPAASAAMVQPSNGKPAYMIVAGLPATPNNKVYQLWLIRGSRPHSAQTFTSSGNGPQIVHLTTPVLGYSQTALTLEPGPKGSPLPTGQMLLRAKLTA